MVYRLTQTESDLAAQEAIISSPFAKQAELEQKTSRFNEVMAILNPKDEQVIGDEGDVQYQARKPFDDERKKRYNKHSKRSETESLFLQWENGSASVGEAKQFVRFGKTHYYEKTAEGCIEITASQYAEKRGVHLGENYRRAYNKIDAAAYHDEARKARDIRNSGILRNNGGAEILSRHTLGEELRHDAGGSVSSVDRDSARVSDGVDNTQYQQRTSPLTDREVLSIAASEVNVEGLTDGERDALNIFKRRLDNLNELEQKRAEEGRKYKEQQFGANVDRAEAQKTLNRMKILDDQIKRASSEVLDVEKKEVLKRVLQRSRKVVEKAEREHGQELLRRYRDRRNNSAAIKKYRDRIAALGEHRGQSGKQCRAQRKKNPHENALLYCFHYYTGV